MVPRPQRDGPLHGATFDRCVAELLQFEPRNYEGKRALVRQPIPKLLLCTAVHALTLHPQVARWSVHLLDLQLTLCFRSRLGVTPAARANKDQP